ncbi:SURF1 family protein [Bartonella sp. DGB1]|uniref:SURF1 family protein n=1 Tax=Bartonella sp. DGB1 TaxID=3239807 RepID=UPI0035260F61
MSSSNNANHTLRRKIANFLFYCFFLSFFSLFTFLGIWQWQRLHWKENLITKVEQRVNSNYIIPPDITKWDKITFEEYEYTPLKMNGVYLNDKEILVNSVAESGAGYWLMTPFVTENNMIIFVNRGFVPMDKKRQETRSEGLISGVTQVKGLLRMSEKDGRFIIKNKPESDIWYNRNLKQMADKLDLQLVAPYFLDAEYQNFPDNIPQGGLTVISFPNNHLSYMLTWFLLAFMVLVFAIFFIFWGRNSTSTKDDC